MLREIFYISGIALWVLIILHGVFKLLYGDKWQRIILGNLFIGKGLIDSTKDLVKEVNVGEVSEDTLGGFIGNVIKRFSRIGIFSLLIASIPMVLLLQQNKLISSQNNLFSKQNDKVEMQVYHDSIQSNLLIAQNTLFNSQNNLFDKQNKLVTEQNDKVEAQVKLVESQNKLLAKQTEKLDTQNHRLNIQNNIIEEDRRSSLVELLSNILDKVDEEISIQKSYKRPSEIYLATLSEDQIAKAAENKDSLVLESLRRDLEL